MEYTSNSLCKIYLGLRTLMAMQNQNRKQCTKVVSLNIRGGYVYTTQQ